MSTTKIPDPYRHLTLESGQQGVVFECFAHGGVGKLRGLYLKWKPDTYYTIHFDGTPLESKTTRQIGESMKLEKFDPPFEFKDKLTIAAYNNSGETFTFEIIVNGEVEHG